MKKLLAWGFYRIYTGMNIWQIAWHWAPHTMLWVVMANCPSSFRLGFSQTLMSLPARLAMSMSQEMGILNYKQMYIHILNYTYIYTKYTTFKWLPGEHTWRLSISSTSSTFVLFLWYLNCLYLSTYIYICMQDIISWCMHTGTCKKRKHVIAENKLVIWICAVRKETIKLWRYKTPGLRDTSTCI